VCYRIFPVKIKLRGGDFLNSPIPETTDLFMGAFLICEGCGLRDIRVRNNGRKIAVFRITGENLSRLDREYRSGDALVNPVRFRESLNRLRDMLFEKLHETDQGRRYDEIMEKRPRRHPRA
jgi:hypothetical protein